MIQRDGREGEREETNKAIFYQNVMGVADAIWLIFKISSS